MELTAEHREALEAMEADYVRRISGLPFGPAMLVLRGVFFKLDDRRNDHGWFLNAGLTAVGIIVVIAAMLLAIISLAVSEFAEILREVASFRPTHSNPINKTPGATLLRLVNFLYSTGTVEKTFKPIIADWRTEYFEATCQGSFVKARLISAGYAYRFVAAMALSTIYSFLRSLTSAGK